MGSVFRFGPRDRLVAAGVLALWVAGGSYGFLQEHVGTWVLPFYTVIVALILVAGCRLIVNLDSWMERHVGWLFLACFLGLVSSHVLLHPLEDGRGVLQSSDRDEALEVAVGRGLDGEYPYYSESSLAGPLSVLPGGILLASPFVLMGKVGLINAVWLIGFLWVMRKELATTSGAVWLFAWSMGVSPAALYEFVSGGDLLANAIYVAVGVWACLRLWSDHALQVIPAVLVAAFLGVAVASRANFVLVCPVVIAWLWHRSGWHRAICCAGVTGGVSLGLILGFYFWSPEEFTPFMSRGKLNIEGAPVWASSAILGVTCLAVAGFSVAFLQARVATGIESCFRACSWIVLAPILGAALVSSWVNGRIDLSILHDRFGLMWVPFALLGWGGAVASQRKDEITVEILR